jgi:hypothetical protein
VALHRVVLRDLVARPGHRGLTWPHIQRKENLDGLERMQGRAWNRAVERQWLAQALEHGFSVGESAEPRCEGEDVND